MKAPIHKTNDISIFCGDALSVLKEMPDESVNCCVTSPPYWGLRDYTICPCRTGRIQHASSTMKGSQAGTPSEFGKAKPDCPKCKGTGHVECDGEQLGLEQTPEEYVAGMVKVFREVRRLLRDDGTLWLNLGDSYNAAGRNGHGSREGFKQGTNRASANGDDDCRGTDPGLKPKDLCGIPWRVAFALQADGWYLRQDIIWHKPNPMPESVTDRCTKAHEYIFLLSKSERYYYDAEAIKEPALDTGRENGRDGRSESPGARPPGSNPRTLARLDYTDRGRNKRSVWTVPSAPCKESHFATFPPKLIEPCILAGCPVGGTVLDPFGGSGTTGMVSLQYQRKCVLIELNPAYIEIMKKKIRVIPTLL